MAREGKERSMWRRRFWMRTSRESIESAPHDADTCCRKISWLSKASYSGHTYSYFSSSSSIHSPVLPRLTSEWAKRTWNKKVVGVLPHCKLQEINSQSLSCWTERWKEGTMQAVHCIDSTHPFYYYVYCGLTTGRDGHSTAKAKHSFGCILRTIRFFMRLQMHFQSHPQELAHWMIADDEIRIGKMLSSDTVQLALSGWAADDE